MSKHDAWVELKPQNPLTDALHLFEMGMIPMRDPFAMASADTPSGEKISLWIVDLNRLDDSQFDAIADVLAIRCNASSDEVKLEAIAMGEFALDADWIESIYCGVEGIARSIELARFLETVDLPPDPDAFEKFTACQYRRWIDGDEIPPPLPASTQQIDRLLRTPNFDEAFIQHQMSQILANPDDSESGSLASKITGDI